jgi:hypothetical protein
VPTARAPAATLLLALLLAGCVERRFVVRSDPEGIPVRVNGVVHGPTPFEIPFEDYGHVRLETDAFDRDGDGLPEYRGFDGSFHLWAPWYQWFPLDFFSDNLWPATIEVRREAVVVLEPALSPLRREDEEALRSRLGGLRARAEKERLEQEARPPAPAPPRPAEKPR